MTKEELIKRLKEHDLSTGELIDELESNALNDEFGDVETVDTEGNHEGGGEYSHYVFLFKDHGLHVKVTGCYTSYNGTDWENDWTIVEPKQEMITVYK